MTVPVSSTGLCDADLLSAVADGDRRALEVLYRRHAPWITARLQRRCSDPGVVDEVLQDAFVAVWRGAGRYDGRGEVGAWLWGAAGYAASALVAYGRDPVSTYGEAYLHVPLHAVSAGVAALAAVGAKTLRDRATTRRAHRAGRAVVLAWTAVTAVLLLETWGAGIDGGYGDVSVHSLANVLLGPAALVLVAAHTWAAAVPGGAGPRPLRAALLVAIPATIAVGSAGSPVALAVCLAAAAAWAGVALTATRTRERDPVPA